MADVVLSGYYGGRSFMIIKGHYCGRSCIVLCLEGILWWQKFWDIMVADVSLS